MTCTNFPKNNLVPNVTQHQVGNVTYLYKGGAPTAPLWEAITGPLAAKGVTVEGGGSVQDFIDKVEGGDLTVIADGSTTPRRLGERFADVVNVKDFGAKGDGVTDDTSSFQLAVDYSESVNGSLYIPTGDYLLGSTVFVKCSIWSNGARVFGKLLTLLEIDRDNVTLVGITLECMDSTELNTKAAPHVIRGESVSNFRLNRCNVKNGKISLVTPLDTPAERKVIITNCFLDINLDLYEAKPTENDGVTLGGYEEVLFTNNIVNLNNVHRGIKIKGTKTGYVLDSSGDSKYIVISGNTIKAITTSGKQVIDLFSGTRHLVFSNNAVHATGFGSVIENKTSRGFIGEQLNTIVSANVIDCDTYRPFGFEGFYGNVDDEYDKGYCSVTISSNSVRVRNYADGEVVSDIAVRHYHKLLFHGNTYTIDFPNVGSRLVVSQCKQCTISSNAFTNILVGLSDAINNQQGYVFNSKFGSISIVNNDISDYVTGYYTGGVSLRSIDAADCAVVISQNNISNNLAKTSATGAVSIQYCNIHSMTISGNSSRVSTLNENRAYMVSVQGEVSEINNSWNGSDKIIEVGELSIIEGEQNYYDISGLGNVVRGTSYISDITHSQSPLGVYFYANVVYSGNIRVYVASSGNLPANIPAGTIRFTISNKSIRY